jgi:hypothetical protein
VGLAAGAELFLSAFCIALDRLEVKKLWTLGVVIEPATCNNYLI